MLTQGKKGSTIYSGGQEYNVPIAPVQNLLDPTGAGDAYRGGFFAALQANQPLPVAGRVGALASAYALEFIGTTAHKYDAREFVDRYEATFGEDAGLREGFLKA